MYTKNLCQNCLAVFAEDAKCCPACGLGVLNADKKISATTKKKNPVIKKKVPWKNHIVCTFAVLLVLVILSIVDNRSSQGPHTIGRVTQSHRGHRIYDTQGRLLKFGIFLHNNPNLVRHYSVISWHDNCIHVIQYNNIFGTSSQRRVRLVSGHVTYSLRLGGFSWCR